MPRSPARILATLLFVVSALLAILPTRASAAQDWPISGGQFFTEANGQGGTGTTGYSVVDDASASFWTEFQRFGGVDVLGYPVSQRFTWDGFVVQAFQKVVLQWRPESGHADFLNVFDRLSQAGKDGWLATSRLTPPSFDNSADATLSWNDIVARHVALLDANSAIKARYFADSDPIQHYGLPMSYQNYGTVFVVRAQRAVLQQWLVAEPWAAAGQVVIANGGDNAKDAGVYPAAAIQPESGPPASVTTDPRFGVIGPSDLASAFPRLGASWWYSDGQPVPSPSLNRVGQISLRPDQVNLARTPVSVLQADAQRNPGGYWIIGNEPNVPGQDNVTPDAYAVELKYYVDAIKGADPTAKIVAPNILNFDATCSGCGGMTAGRAWLDGFRTAWASRYGGEPPVDVWGLHAYTITWDQLPMTDVATIEQQISAMSDYLAAIPAQQGKPLWLTEFGVIWGYPGFTSVTSGCAGAPQCIAPTGAFDQAAVAGYLNNLLGWFTANSARYRLAKWFVFTAYGSPEPYATAYGGISLLTAPSTTADLTPLGQIYASYVGH